MKGREKDINDNYLRPCHPDGITSAAVRTCRNAAWVSMRSSQRRAVCSGEGQANRDPGPTPTLLVMGLPSLSTFLGVNLT